MEHRFNDLKSELIKNNFIKYISLKLLYTIIINLNDQTSSLQTQL